MPTPIDPILDPNTVEGRVERELTVAILIAMHNSRPMVTLTICRADAMLMRSRLLKLGKKKAMAA